MSIHSGYYTLTTLDLDYVFDAGSRFCARIPAGLAQEKLQAIGYEIAGEGTTKRAPAIIRGESPTITVKIDSHVEIVLPVTRIQTMLRRSIGDFDVYEYAEPPKKLWRFA